MEGIEIGAISVSESERCAFRWLTPVDPANIVSVVFADGNEEIKVPLGE